LAAAIADERIQINPASAVPLPTERQKPPRYLSPSEVERLADEMPPQYRALVLVGAYGGLRWGEAAGLRRRDIDPMRSRIRITSTAVELRARHAGRRTLPSWGRNVLRPAVLRAGLDDITFHGLRHSFVAIMVAAGCNVREVSEWAGHISVAFTLTRHGGLFGRQH
jgi:integrase